MGWNDSSQLKAGGGEQLGKVPRCPLPATRHRKHVDVHELAWVWHIRRPDRNLKQQQSPMQRDHLSNVLQNRDRLRVVPIVNDVLRCIDIRARHHALKEVACHSRSALSQTGCRKTLLGPFNDIVLIKQDAIYSWMSFQDCLHLSAMPAGHITHALVIAKLERSGDRVVRLSAEVGHRLIENGGPVRIVAVMSPEVRPLGQVRSDAAVPDNVNQLAPRIPVFSKHRHARHAAHAVGPFFA